MKDTLRAANTDALIIGSGLRPVAHVASRLLDSPYPVLYDADRAVYRAYGLEKRVGLLQRSGTFVIDPHGRIVLAQSALNPFDAMNRREIGEALSGADR